MPGIGVKNLMMNGIEYSANFISQFIASSTNIKNSIKEFDEECMVGDASRNVIVALIRDTYVCNLLLGYVAVMKLISDDDRFDELDAKLLAYVDEFYRDDDFKVALCNIYSVYREAYENSLNDLVEIDNSPATGSSSSELLEFTRFLERMIDRLQITGKRASIMTYTKMLENKIYNLMNVTPSIAVDIRYIKGIENLEIISQKTKKNGGIVAEIPLTFDNYMRLMYGISDNQIRHQIESSYNARTTIAMKDFADLIVYRKLFANEMGYGSYFQYVCRDKKDSSEVIKKLIMSLNLKLNDNTRSELSQIHEYQNRFISQPWQRTMVTPGDTQRYRKIHSPEGVYDKYVVMYHLFQAVKRYFGISVRKFVDPNADSSTEWAGQAGLSDFAPFKSFELYIEGNDERVLGRLYLDLEKSQTKKIIDPIAIKVSDRMLISDDMYSLPEVVLIANYDHSIDYAQAVQLFREFGYVLQELCYHSRVGCVNRDPEFSTFVPLIFEHIAWDSEIVNAICRNKDEAEHIIMTRHFDLCTSLKHKCVASKFDHMIHNSDEVVDILINIANDEKDGNDVDRSKTENVVDQSAGVIIDLYNAVYRESFESCHTVVDVATRTPIDPLVIVQEINGNQGLVYSTIMNEIFSYASYYILKNGIRSPREFRTMVLEDGITPIRDSISDFMNCGVNSFQLYTNQLLNIQDYTITPSEYGSNNSTDEVRGINTEYDSNVNHFDDRDYVTETEGDVGSIIRVNRLQ